MSHIIDISDRTILKPKEFEHSEADLFEILDRLRNDGYAYGFDDDHGEPFSQLGIRSFIHLNVRYTIFRLHHTSLSPEHYFHVVYKIHGSGRIEMTKELSHDFVEELYEMPGNLYGQTPLKFELTT